MSGDVIVTVTLNAALHVAYTDGRSGRRGHQPGLPAWLPGGRPRRDGGAGAARLRARRPRRRAGRRRLRRADHPGSGQVGGADGVHAHPRRVPAVLPLRRARTRTGRCCRFSEPGPYITTEELGRFAADYRRLMAGAAAVVLCGSLPDGLPADTYGSLVTYAAEAGVPVILDAGGEELKHAIGHGPDLVVAESSAAEAGIRRARRGPDPAGRGRGRRRGRRPGPRGDPGRRVDGAPGRGGRRSGRPVLPPGPRRAGGGPGARPVARLVLAGPAQARPGPGRGRRRGLDQGARRRRGAGSR